MWNKVLEFFEPKNIFNSIIMGTIFLLFGYLVTENSHNNSRSLKETLQNCKYNLFWLRKGRLQSDLGFEDADLDIIYKKIDIKITSENYVDLQYYDDGIFTCRLNILEHKKELSGICKGEHDIGRMKLTFNKKYTSSKGVLEYDSIPDKKYLVFLTKKNKI
ncbi:MAG: hypothetical protein HRT87_03055 [Legionellales bacterium]|nr:hypothetical protein [Legionellales bacterium]